MLLKAVFREMFGSVNITAQKSNWLKLKDIGEVVGGATPKTTESKFWNGPYKWITPAEIFQDSYWISNTERTLTEEGINSSALKVLPPNTVLLTSRAPIGKTALTACNMYCNQGFKNIICSEKINPEYLNYILHNNSDYLNSLGRGATFKEVSKSIVENIKVPVPVVKKQKQFVSYIHQKQKVEATLQLMLEKLELLKKAKFKEMFGNHVSTVMLGDCCEIHARIGWQALTQKEHMQSGQYMLVTGTDFVNNSVNYDTCVYISKERYEMDLNIILKNDDILVTKDGTIGKVAIVKNLSKPATLNSGIFVIRPDNRFDKEYIAAVFKGNLFSAFVDSVKTGATIKHLNQNKLVTFKIPVPSLKDQQAYSKILAQIEHTKQKITKALLKLTDKS